MRRSSFLLGLALPIPRQKLADAFGRIVGQSCEHVGEPGLRIDAVELGGLDQRVDGGGALAALVGAGEGPVGASDRDAAQCPLSGVVRHAQAAVVEGAGERRPALEAVVDRLGGLEAARKDRLIARNMRMALEYRRRRAKGSGKSDSALKAEIGAGEGLKRRASIDAINASLKLLNRFSPGS
jgi:hypothetical protein